MSITLQSSVNGVVRVHPLDSYARLGSSPDCDVVVTGAGIPAHALTIVEDGVDACRVIVKSGGVSFNGEMWPEASVIPLVIGNSLQLHGVTLSLVPATPERRAGQAAVVEQVRDYLPEVSASNEELAAAANPTASPPKSSGSSVAIQIAGILACLLAIAGMAGWMFFGGGNGGADVPGEGANKVRLTDVIAGVQNQPDWPWRTVSREEVLDLLQRANHLESHGNSVKARKVLIQIRERLLDEVPTDAMGHYVLPEPEAGASTTAEGPTAAEARSKAGQGTLAEALFPEKDRRRLYENIVRIAAELGGPSAADPDVRP